MSSNGQLPVIQKPRMPPPTPQSATSASAGGEGAAIPSLLNARDRPSSGRVRPKTVIVQAGQSWPDAHAAIRKPSAAPPTPLLVDATAIRKPAAAPPTPPSRLSSSPSSLPPSIVKPSAAPPQPPATISKPAHAPPRPTGAGGGGAGQFATMRASPTRVVSATSSAPTTRAASPELSSTAVNAAAAPVFGRSASGLVESTVAFDFAAIPASVPEADDPFDSLTSSINFSDDSDPSPLDSVPRAAAPPPVPLRVSSGTLSRSGASSPSSDAAPSPFTRRTTTGHAAPTAPPAVAARTMPLQLSSTPPVPSRRVAATIELPGAMLRTSSGGPPMPAARPMTMTMPFVRSRAQPSAAEAQHFDGDIDMRQFPFYFGELTSQAAMALLDKAGVGTYLVRLSSRVGSFAITWVRSKDQIIHSLLTRNARGEWSMEADGPTGGSWANIPEVLASFRKVMTQPFVKSADAPAVVDKIALPLPAKSASSGALVSPRGETLTIIVNIHEHAPIRVPLAADTLLSDAAQQCMAFAKQRGVYLDAHVGYALYAEDGELLPSNAALDALPLVRKARKKRQEPAFLLMSSSGAVSSRLAVFLPNGEAISLAYDGDKRAGTLVQELRKLAPLTAEAQLMLCALAPEEHESAAAAASSAPVIETIDESRLLRDVPTLTRARQAGLPLRLALVRTALLGHVSTAAALARVISRPEEWLTDGNEAGAFRVAMARVRLEHVQLYGLGASTQACEDGAPLPSKVMVQLVLPLGKKLVAALPNETADAFVARHFAKLFADMFPAGTQPHDVVLHSPAALDYVYGPYELATFEYVRQQCMGRGGKCDLVPALAYWTGATQAAGDAQYDAQAASAPGAATDADAAAVERSHQSVAAEALPWHAMQCISVGDVVGTLRVCIMGAELPLPRYEVATAAGVTHLRVTIGVFFGGAPLAADGDGLRHSRSVPLSEGARWNEWCDVGVAVANLPHEARLCVTLWGCVGEQQATVPLGWANLLLFDFRHVLRRGTQLLPLWPDEAANPIGTCSRNEADGSRAASVALGFHEYALPVVHVSGIAAPAARLRGEPSAPVRATLEELAAADPLLPLTDEDKRVLWQNRDACMAWPRLLPKVLSSAPMRHGNQAVVVAEIKQLASAWRPFATPTDAFELLDARFADQTVRELAVAYLERLTNEDLLGYLLQLVQVLKYEPYHDSALARFLLRRALGNRVLGHNLFWYLRAEMHVGDISRRFGLLLEAYLRGAGAAMHSLRRQSELVAALTAAAERIKPLKDGERLRTLRGDLQKLSDALLAREPIDSTLDPRIKLGPLRVDKCKYMDSKKLPLWLVFSNAGGGDDVYIIFKAGDDLRQDMLTLQMIRLMNKLWTAVDLDLQMSPYGCVATGDEIGMIEVVLNSETTAKITAAAGGVTAAFRSDPLLKWMEAAAAAQQVALRQLTASFARSCAGYAVATYILGIGDRHNDNVMVRRTGQLFHIDFGHFLGNYKSKFGIRRESAPFVFTPDFARVLGGKEGQDFADFVEYGAKALNVLRRHASLFLTLFAMMLSTGIPELQSITDIDYLREALMLTASESEAARKWDELVNESLSSKLTRLNNAAHLLAH